MFEVLKVLHDMTLLFPEIDQLLELHLAFHVENVLGGKILNKSVSFKLLSDLGLDLVCWDV